MTKIKKTLLGTLLSCLMAVCLCFGIVHIKNDTKTVSAATLTTTTVTKLQHRSNANRLLIFLENTDYSSVNATTSAGKDIEAAGVNLLDKILLYTDDNTYVTLREAWKGNGQPSYESYYNVWGDTNSICLDTTLARGSIKYLTVLDGCTFPSASTHAAGYKQNGNVTFYNNGYGALNDCTDWTKQGTAKVPAEYWKLQDTAVTSLKYANHRLGIKLSVSDYANAANNTFTVAETKFEAFNTLTNITVNRTTLADLWTAAAKVWPQDCSVFMQMWGEPGLWVPMTEPASGTEVVIPAGTQFPSYSAISGSTVNVYVTTADVTYVYAGNGKWVEKVDFAETVVTAAVNRYADKRLMLTITGGDYSGAPATKSYDASKLGQLNTLDYILINGTSLRTLLSEAQTKEYFVNLYKETGLAFGQLTITAGDVVTIKKGTQFPSWAYINAGTATCYVTDKEVSFKCSNTGIEHADWGEVLDFNEIATGIARVDFSNSTNINPLYVYLTNNDYGNTEPNVDFSGKVAALNMGEYIEIDGVKLSDMTLAGRYINLWQRWGAFGLQLKDYNTPKVPTYIRIKAGCQIPSLSYAKGESLDVYVIEEDTWVVYNAYYRVWDITKQAPEMTVAIGDILPAYESTADRIFLGWEINGGLYQGGKAAPVAGVATAAWLDYALEDGASIRMADNAEQSGIRFTAHLQEESYNTYQNYIHSIGVLVLPLELLGTEEFTVGHSAQPVNFYALKEKGYEFKDGVLTVRGTIHSVRDTNYDRDYAARAYVSVTYAGGTTANAYGCFQEENHVRNIYEVATAAYKANDYETEQQQNVLVGYISRIADITFDGTTFTKTEGTIGSAIASIQTQSIVDGVVTLSIATNLDIEPLLVVNGKPIRGARILEKEYGANLYTVSFLYEQASNLTYYASDDTMQQFFQDYFELYTMSGSYAVAHSRVSNGPTYQQDWYMNAMSWFKATDLVVNEDSATQNGTYSADDYALYYLNNIDIDKNGNVYSEMNDRSCSTADGGPAYSTVTSYYVMNSQGWALPNMETTGWEAYHAEFNGGTLNETLAAEKATYSYPTNKDKSSGWKANGNSLDQVDGVVGYTGTAQTGRSNVTGATNAIVYEVTGLSYYAFNAPFVEVRLLLDDPYEAITDYAIEWQTGGNWYSVKQSEYANNPYVMPNATGMYRSYFPLYTHPNYGAGKVVTSNESASDYNKITGLRVVLIAKDTTSPVTAKLDYVRATADSRHSVNGPKYIIALNEYASNHNDIELLVNNITRARRAMLFQLEPLQGKNGLVNLSYLHRHDSYQGAPNSYWDIYPAGNLNTEANIYFYEGLLALAEMEEALTRNGIKVTETASIEWHDLSGEKQTATYSYTADSLRTLAEETVKGKIQTTFYNDTTGRFAWSVRDVKSKSGNAAGSLMDYGFTELNLYAVAAGVASAEQATFIMLWINGTRKVDGDKVSGSGIYEQPFAPVTTTVDNQKKSGLILKESDFSEYYNDKDYGVQVQDGGTIMHVSYYDILARAKVLGVENAYGRISAIASWFAKVQAKNTNAATDGWQDFFANYYNGSGDLQGEDGAGKYGLQDEFKEAVMVMATAPKIFLGLEAHYDTLTIAPNLGSLAHFGMENLAFGEKTYACYATASSISLSGISGNVNSGLKVTLKLAYTDGQSVYLNGKLLDSGKDEYKVENGYVIVTTDFADLTLQVK